MTKSGVSPNSNNADADLLPALEVDELLTQVQQSHGMYYKMMNLEVWALVETLDQFFPGSWGHFMTNRQVALKEFLQRKQTKRNTTSPFEAHGSDNPEPPPSESPPME